MDAPSFSRASQTKSQTESLRYGRLESQTESPRAGARAFLPAETTDYHLTPNSPVRQIQFRDLCGLKVRATMPGETNLRFGLTAFECRHERPSSSFHYHNLRTLLLRVVPRQSLGWQHPFEMAQRALDRSLVLPHCGLAAKPCQRPQVPGRGIQYVRWTLARADGRTVDRISQSRHAPDL